MEDKPTINRDDQIDIQAIMNTMVKVITSPVEFYNKMATSGGLINPIIFVAVIGVLSGAIQFIINLFSISDLTGSLATLLISFIIVPILVIIFCFITAAVMFFIWKLLGSENSFEIAFRCVAYASAINIITTPLNTIPYIGAVIGLSWMVYLMIVASTEVHSIEAKKAMLVFGIIGALLILFTLKSQQTSREVSRKAELWQDKIERKMEDMAPDEAGKAVGEFLKGLEESTEKK